jgi:hypothetical protein
LKARVDVLEISNGEMKSDIDELEHSEMKLTHNLEDCNKDNRNHYQKNMELYDSLN